MTLPVRSLDHTAIAVHSIEAALPLYRDVLGGVPQEYSSRPQQGFVTLVLRYPNGAGVELIAPAGDEGFVQRFLRERGEGVHHMTFLVSDLAASIEQARAAGLRVVGEDFTNPDWLEAFISPRSAHGTIVQLAETPRSLEERTRIWSPDAYRVDRAAAED